MKPEKPLYRRCTEDYFEELTDIDRKRNQVHRKKKVVLEERTIMHLRPPKEERSKIERAAATLCKEKEDSKDDDVHGYRIWQAKIAIKACAMAQRQHDEEQPSCKEFVRLSGKEERKVGVATAETFMCDGCTYKSEMQKFYEEIAKDGPGRKVAVPNMAVQVALASSGMGVTNFREFAATMDIPVPCKSWMVEMSKTCSDIMVCENEEDMKAWTKIIKELNAILGKEHETAIKAEADTRYKSPLYAGLGKKPGQPSSYAFTTLTDNVSRRGKVLATHLGQKQCSTCNQDKSRQRRKGRRRNQVQKHKGKCTANMKPNDVIGNEEIAGREIGKKLQSGSEKVRISHVTTDGDSSFARGLSDAMMEETGEGTKPLRDHVHMGKNAGKAVRSTKWSTDMFPGRTAVSRNKIKSRFAEEFRARLHAEHEAAVERYGKRRQKIEEAMQKAIQAGPGCYSGSHELCSTHSMVCNKKKRWKSIYLPAGVKLNPRLSDLADLKRIAEKRVGKTALAATRYCTDTCKAESLNRGFSKNVPKSNNWIETLAGRFATAVMNANNGISLSLLKRRKAAHIPLDPRSPTIRVLDSLEKDRLYRRQLRVELQTKRNARANKAARFQTYDETQELGTYKTTAPVPAKKRKLPARKKQPRGKADHTYNKMEGEGPLPPNTQFEWTSSEDETN